MHLPHVNYLSVLVSGIAIFILGGLWYSPALFAKPWMRLIGKSEEEMKAQAGPMPLMFLGAFLCGLLSAYVLAIIINHFQQISLMKGAEIGALCWIGFAAPTSFATAIFSCKPKALWAIDSGFNLASFVIAGLILSTWH